MEYRMFTDTELKDFRSWMATCPFDRLAEGAYDSKPRRAKDEEGEGTARRVVNMLMALKEQLGDETFQGLCERLCEADEPEEAAEDDEVTGGDPSEQFETPMQREMADKAAKDKRRAKDARKAKDSPPPFEGKPSTHAEDSANDPRFDYLRDAAKVKPSRPGAAYGDRSSQAARNGATSPSFDRMFPDAAKVAVR